LTFFANSFVGTDKSESKTELKFILITNKNRTILLQVYKNMMPLKRKTTIKYM